MSARAPPAGSSSAHHPAASGAGVTNYDVDRPSFAFEAPSPRTTTEFDDALVSRGILTREQCLVAKGASPREARRLVALAAGAGEESSTGATAEASAATGGASGRGRRGVPGGGASSAAEGGGGGDDSSDDDSGDSDEDDCWFDRDYQSTLDRYRQMRLAEWRGGDTGADDDDGTGGGESSSSSREGTYGEVGRICRSDWAREVNDASRGPGGGRWVVVHLTSEAFAECVLAERAVSALAARFPRVKFVSIPSRSAIEDWPDDSLDHLPAIFLYRDGTMRHQMIGLEAFGGPGGVTADRLEWRLANVYGVVETGLKEDPPPRTRFDKLSEEKFGGVMARLATCDRDNDEDDYHDHDP